MLTPVGHPALSVQDDAVDALPPLDLEMLDWTARQKVRGKRGATPTEAPAIVQRPSMSAETWCELVHNFGRLFYHVAGKPERIEATRSRQTNRRFHTSAQSRSLTCPTATPNSFNCTVNPMLAYLVDFAAVGQEGRSGELASGGHQDSAFMDVMNDEKLVACGFLL